MIINLFGKRCHLPLTLPNALSGFQNSFTSRLSHKFLVKQQFNIHHIPNALLHYLVKCLCWKSTTPQSWVKRTRFIQWKKLLKNINPVTSASFCSLRKSCLPWPHKKTHKLTDCMHLQAQTLAMFVQVVMTSNSANLSGSVLGWSTVLCKTFKFIKIYLHKYKYVLSYVVKICCKYGVSCRSRSLKFPKGSGSENLSKNQGKLR